VLGIRHRDIHLRRLPGERPIIRAAVHGLAEAASIILFVASFLLIAAIAVGIIQ